MINYIDMTKICESCQCKDDVSCEECIDSGQCELAKL